MWAVERMHMGNAADMSCAHVVDSSISENLKFHVLFNSTSSQVAVTYKV